MRFAFRSTLLGLALSLAVPTASVRAQEAFETLEREARAAVKAQRYKDAALKFQDAAAAAPDSTKRGKMGVQSAYYWFVTKDVKASRDAVRKAVQDDPDLEIVPEFYSPDFVKLFEEVRRATRPVPTPSQADVTELKRVAAEKLKDGRSEEVVYDLSSIPAEKRDKDSWTLLADAYDRLGRAGDAAAARRAATGDLSGIPAPAPPSSGPAPASAPSPVVPFPSASRGADATELLAAGRSALDRGDFFSAQSSANDAIKLQPTSSEAYRLLGDTWRARDDKILAEANWAKAVEYDPRNEAALLTLAASYLSDGGWDKALDAYRRAAEINPKNGEKLLAIGRKARADGDLVHARQTLAAAAAAAPSDVPLLTEYASLLIEAKEYEAAEEPLIRAVATAPGQAVVRANLAAVLRQRGKLKEAEREYGEALRLEPAYVPALVGLGALQLTKETPADAIEPFREAVAKEPRNVPAVLGLARAQRLSGDLEGAAVTLEAVQGLDQADVWNEAGAIAYARGRYAESVALFDKAMAKDPALAAAKANRDKALAASTFLKGAGAESN